MDIFRYYLTGVERHFFYTIDAVVTIVAIDMFITCHSEKCDKRSIYSKS